MPLSSNGEITNDLNTRKRMNIKRLFIAICAVTLSMTGSANAQFFSGSITVSNSPIYAVAFATGSSLMLSGTNLVAKTTGGFTGVVPLEGLFLVQFGDPAEINGLSASPLTDSINNFFVFSTGYEFGPGTTPPNRFDFDLQTITEDPDGIGDFSGTGTLIDNGGVYGSSPAEFTVDFTSANNYILTLDVPEPATIGLVTTGLLGLWVFRRRKA
jgi:hypothetical protein